MNYAWIEKTLESLIRKHGIETVELHLRTLIGEARWSVSESLRAQIRNANNRLERKKRKNQQ